MSDLSHCAVILPVNNIQESTSFYTNQLGFSLYASWGTPMDYAVLKRDGITINLTAQDTSVTLPTANSLYIFCHDIQDLYTSFQAKSISFAEPLNQTEYGMREFVVEDNTGYRLAFGQSAS